MTYNDTKLTELFKRVYNNKMIETEEVNDATDIKEYCSKVFGNGNFNPDPSLLHQFNNLVVETANEITKPKVDDMIGLLATVKRGNRGDIIKYEIPQKTKVKFRWSARGSGVDLVRVENKKSEIAVPERFSTGFYYEPMDFVSDSVGAFQDLIDKLADAKVKMYFEQLNKLTAAAITANKIPAVNVKVGSNVTLTDYNKIASVIARFGGRPVFIADTALIDHFAYLQTGFQSGNADLISDKTKDELLRSLNITAIGRTDAVNLVNPFINDANTKTDLPVNTGYMFAGNNAQKPFVLVEFGGLRQATEQDIEDERVKIKLFQEADIELLYGQAIGYIKDSSVTL